MHSGYCILSKSGNSALLAKELNKSMEENNSLNLDYVWNFLFYSFDSASLKASYYNSRNGWKAGSLTGDIYLEKSREKQSHYLKLAKQGILLRQSTLYEFIDSKKPWRVIDLGGGSGWVYAYLVKHLRYNNIFYINLEMQETEEYFKEILGDLPNLFWSLDNAEKNQSDEVILYSNSSLQYFKDNNYLVATIQRVDPDIIILDDLHVGPSNSVFSLQNYWDYMIVNRFLDIEKLRNYIARIGYQEILYRDYESNISMDIKAKLWDGATELSDIPLHKTLVFKRVPIKGSDYQYDFGIHKEEK